MGRQWTEHSGQVTETQFLHLENDGSCANWKARSRSSRGSVIAHPSHLADVGSGTLTSRDLMEWRLLFDNRSPGRNPPAKSALNKTAHARGCAAPSAMHWRPHVATVGITGLVGWTDTGGMKLVFPGDVVIRTCGHLKFVSFPRSA